MTEYIKINYAKADDFRNLLNGRIQELLVLCSELESDTELSKVQMKLQKETDRTGGANINQNEGANGDGGTNEGGGVTRAR